MAYGMNASELARVGQNVNKQGGPVDEQSIESAMSSELDKDRKDQVDKFKSQKNSARSKSAQQKASLKSNLMKSALKAGVTIAEGAEKGAFTKKPDTPEAPEIAPVQIKAGAPDNLVAGKPEARVKLAGKARKTPEFGTKAYADAKDKEFRRMKRGKF